MSEETTTLAVPDTAREELALAKGTSHSDSGPLAYILDTNLFNHLWRVATGYSRSSMVPDIFRGKPDDCFVGLQLALRLEVDPFMLFQSMYVVHGKPGLEAKLAIALTNARGPFKDRIQWKFKGQGMDRECTAYAHDRVSGNICEATVTMKIAKAEGWIDKNGSKWKTIPDLMLQYRSASWLIRLNCPEVLMGMNTRDELEDIGEATYTTSSEPVAVPQISRAEQMAERLKREKAPEPTPEPPFNPPTQEELVQHQETDADPTKPKPTDTEGRSEASQEQTQEREPGDDDEPSPEQQQAHRLATIAQCWVKANLDNHLAGWQTEAEAGLISTEDWDEVRQAALRRKAAIGNGKRK